MFLIESGAALPALLTLAASSLSPPSLLSQQQSRTQVLPGHESGERRCVPLGHQQQEGVQSQITEHRERCRQEPGAGGRDRRPVSPLR